MTKNYKNKEWLLDQYITQEKSTPEIARESKCATITIRRWLIRFNIPRRSYSEAGIIAMNKPATKDKLKLKKGNKSHSWKGGITYHYGYKMVYKPDHPNKKSNNYIYEHILVMEKILGRYLKPGERVHHIDFNKLNNDPENLYLCRNHSHHGKVGTNLFKILPSLLDKGIIHFDKEKGEYYE